LRPARPLRTAGPIAAPRRGYTPGTTVRDLLPFLADLEDTFVIDHMSYMTESNPEFERRLLDLLRLGSCWIKLSGPYRVA
jgi:2-pyrone-4,6-dicarboxylate lactonase